ncbi:MAG: hypothetical protein CMJ75_13875 [Planctomycetaceae bacterium]|nr:hypothetical protein [Planctomycetaceae bacterium]
MSTRFHGDRLRSGTRRRGPARRTTLTQVIYMNPVRTFLPWCLTISVTLGVLSPTLASAAGESWLVDFTQAKELASQEGKDILIEFTGSDWCPPCKALQTNVLSQDIFKREVPKQFILLLLDNPRDKSHQSEEERAQYKELAEAFQVTGVPTVFLADADGRPYAKQVGYSGEKAPQYVANLSEKAKARQLRDQFLAKAEQAQGVGRARFLHQAMQQIDTSLVLTTYQQTVQEIIKLDENNEAGLKNRYAAKIELERIKSSSRIAGPDATLKSVDKLLEAMQPQGRDLQEALFLKAQLIYRQDRAGCKQALITAHKVAPDSDTAKNISRILLQVFKTKIEPKSDPPETDASTR